MENVNEVMPILEFDGKGTDVKDISLANLQKSIRRDSGLAGIRAVPVQYWSFYEQTLALLKASGKNYQEKKIFVQNNASKAYLTDEEKNAGYTQKNAPLNRWRFDKIISLIQLPSLYAEDEGRARNAAIGLTMNKEGLQISFGMNLHMCSNFNVMGGSILRSYGYNGQDGLPWDVMRFRIEQWVNKHEQLWTVQNEIMTEMIQHELVEDTKVIEQVIGDLYVGAIKNAYFKGQATPFNTYELSDFVQESIKQRVNEDKIANVWDLYNWGTSIMKPGMMDIGEIATNSNIWSDYLIDKFSLDVPTLEIQEV